MQDRSVDRFVVISGCSSGGKSTLLDELARRHLRVVAEPGRRIVQDELAVRGRALPWIDLAAFARRAIAMALQDRAAAVASEGWVFFDRSLVDAAAALEYATAEPALARWCAAHRYHPRVFMAPPWPEIYENDPDRPHGFEDSVAEYGRLVAAYTRLGYVLVELPKVSAARRADFVLHALGPPP